MSTLGCAVVGVGWMGGIRADMVAALPGLRLVACCDARPEAAERCPDGARFTTDLAAVLDDPEVEVVFVSTSDGAHRVPAVAALEAGKHVFCEKPLATNLEDADAILDAAARSGRTLAVGQTLRADGRYAAAKRKVESGDLGEPVHCFARRSWPAAEGRRMSGSTTLPLYLSVHDFDALQWISGRQIVRVSGEASAVELDGVTGAPTAVAALRFEGGLVGLHEVSWGLPDQAGLALGDCGLTFVGSDGHLTVDAGTQGVTFSGGPDGSGEPQPVMEFRSRGFVEHLDLAVHDVGLPASAYSVEVAGFTQAIREGRPPLATGAEGRAAVAAALAFEQSLASGTPVAVR